MSAHWEAGPADPELPRGEVHVWRAELTRWQPPAAALSPGERERVAQMRRPGAGERWSAARWALRTVLGRYLGEEPAHVRLRIREGGKPELDEAEPRLRFNLSHSGELALIAVAGEREVGVDVERIDRDRDPLALARHGLEPEAARAVEVAPPAARAEAFHRAWARKEAIAKCFGTGLVAPPPADPIAVLQLDLGPDWAAALAVAGEAPGLRAFYLTIS